MSLPNAAPDEPEAVAGAASLVARVGRALEHPLAPWLAGALGAATVWWLLGTLSPLPWVYDEAAYLLQAEIFASGRWAAAGRPLPEFFEQFHVFVTPKLVPKYPPGHALLLVPGVWAGVPGLIPVLFTGLTTGLMFAWLRRLANAWVAALAVLIWLTAPEILYIQPSYMSQVTSTVVWLLAWGALARWRARGDRGGDGDGEGEGKGGGRWLAAFAALAALGLLIRPVTAVALLAPAGGWIVWHLWRERPGWSGWRQVAVAAAVALPIVAVAPLWSYETSGRAFPTPYSEYSRVYAPWNMPGFRVDGRPPLREPTPALTKFRAEWLPVHEAHRVERLPAILAERVGGLAITFFGGGVLRWLLLGAFALGVAGLRPELRFGLVSAAALVLAHLWIAARPQWTVYYLEGFPAIAAVTALGVWRAATWAGGRLARPGGAFTGSRMAAGLVVAGVLAAVPGTVDRLLRARSQQETLRLVQTDLARAVDSIPGKAIVFVAPGPTHRPHESYVRNVPDLEAARVWVAQDRGADNARLAALAPDRALYRFDPGTGGIEPWHAPAP